MRRHRFTLAALATLAVPGLDVAVTRTFTGGGEGHHHAALLTDGRGAHLVVRAPVDAAAAARLTAESTALGALTAGVRGRLPFTVPSVVGVLPSPPAVVTSYVDGVHLQPAGVVPGGMLAAAIGRAVAAIHDLPTGVVVDADLPSATAGESADAVRRLVARAESGGDVPLELVNRWTAAADDAALWRFRPAVVHGSLAAECVLTDTRTADARVTGVLGWSALAVGDPARDLSWCLGLPAAGAAGAVLDAYRASRPGEVDPALPQRALLYAELELVRWLLFGLEQDDAAIAADAVQMLEALLASVLEGSAGPLTTGRGAPMSLDQVQRLLDARHPAPTDAHAARSSSADAIRGGRTTRSWAT